MIVVFRLFTVFLVPCFLGSVLTLLIFRRLKMPIIFTLSLGFLFGLGFLGLWMVVLSTLHIPFHVATVGAPPIVLAIIGLFFLSKQNETHGGKLTVCFRHKFFAADMLSVALLVVMIGYFAYIFWTALNIPVHVWDEIERVGFKAKHFWFDKTIQDLKYLPHPSYPLLMECALTWIALVFHGWSDQIIRIVTPVLLLAYSVLHYTFLRGFVSQRWALTGVLLLFAAPLVVHQAALIYADVPMMIYNCGAIIILLLWNKERHDGYLLLSGIFGGLAAFTKLEGIFYILIYFGVLAVMFCHQRNTTKGLWKNLVRFALPCLGILFFYMSYKIFTQTPLTERVGFDFTFADAPRLVSVLAAYLINLFLSGNWSLVWLVFCFSLMNGNLKKGRAPIGYIGGCLAAFFVLHFFQFVFTSNYFWVSDDKAYGVLARLTLHYYPLATMLIILLNAPVEDAGS